MQFSFVIVFLYGPVISWNLFEWIKTTDACYDTATEHEPEVDLKTLQTENLPKVEEENPPNNEDQNKAQDSDNKENKQNDKKAKIMDPEYELLMKLQSTLDNPIPRQKPKSGRFWKAERKQFRSLRKDKGNRSALFSLLSVAIYQQL